MKEDQREEFLITDPKVLYALKKGDKLYNQMSTLITTLHEYKRDLDAYKVVVGDYMRSLTDDYDELSWSIKQTNQGLIAKRETEEEKAERQEMHTCNVCEMYVDRVVIIRIADCEDCVEDKQDHHHHILNKSLDDMIVDKKEFNEWLKQKKQLDS